MYTRLSIVSRRKTDFRLQNDKVDIYNIFNPFNKGEGSEPGNNEVNMYDVFKPLNKGQDAMVLVEGSPGIGKTTFCLKIAYDWTNDNIPEEYSFPVFEVMLLLKCRDIYGDIMEAIGEQLLPEDVDEKDKKEVMDYIKDIHNQERILIILDGLDELPNTAEKQVDKLLHRRILPFCYVLATSRQERGIVVRQQVDFDILLQIEGFTEDDAFDYIRKHFRHFGPEHLSKGERLVKAIKENTFLRALPSNPLNLLLLCVVFEQYEGKLPSVRTELYQIIVRCLLRRFCGKHKLKVPEDDKVLEGQFEESLLTLGELAWRCLLEDRHSFREEELARFERRNKDLAARKLGLVFKEASTKRLNPQHEYHFFHKTFQEYLAALYLAHKMLKEQLNVFRESELDFSKHIVHEYRQVFLFVSGILGERASVLFGQIGETLKSGGWDWLKCSDEEATFFTGGFMESGSSEQVAMALCSFIPFPLTVDIDKTSSTNIFMFANAWKSFLQIQHPVHVTAKDHFKPVVDFISSWPQLSKHSFSIGLVSDERLTDSLCKALSKDLTLVPLTDKLLQSINPPYMKHLHLPFTLAASKTSPTVTFKLVNEQSDAWAIILESGSSSHTPLNSVVVKIYDLTRDTGMRALKNILSNRSVTSLEVIIHGDMTDSQATAVGEGLAAEAILKSLTLIVYGKLSYSGAVSLNEGFLENTSLNTLKVKVFGEVPDNWLTVIENLLMAKKSLMSITVHPEVISNITDTQVACLSFLEENSLNVKLQSLTLNLWGNLSCNGAEALSKFLIESSTSHATLNFHGRLTGDVADCLVRCLKQCKTLSSLIINPLQELSCNQTYSFDCLNFCCVTSGESLKSTIDVSSSLTSVLTKIKDASKRKFDFKVTSNSDMSGEWGCGLSDGLAENTSLTTLSLTWNSCSDISEDWRHGLGDGLAKDTSLTALSLTLNSCSDMSGDWAHVLGDGLAKNKSLTALSLALDSCNYMGRDWAHDLGDGLARNTSLTTFSLALTDNISGTYRLGDGLAENTSLTTLILKFESYTGKRSDWPHFLEDCLAKNTSLTTLKLTFMRHERLHGRRLDKCMGEGLVRGLGETKSLTTLSVTFNSCSGMTGEWGHGLGDALAENTSLTTLCLTFNNCSGMSRKWAHGLGYGLGKNTSLTTLCLTFNSCCVMSGKWGHGLGYGLAENTSLTTLCLTFNGYGDERRDWVHGLGKGLAKNTSFTTLCLTFNCYSDMSEDWTRGLSDGLAKNRSLTTLSLTFNIYSNMSGDWGRGLSDGLAKNKSLTALSLTLNSYSDMSGGWGRGLGDGLAKNRSLTAFSLTFNNYRGTSGEWLNNLVDSLKKSDAKDNLIFTINIHNITSSLFGCNLSKHLQECEPFSYNLHLTVSLYGEEDT